VLFKFRVFVMGF